MIIRTILLTALLLLTIPAQAEESWWDSALNFLGLGDETSEPTKTAGDATSDMTGMAKDAAMSSLTDMVTGQLGVSKAQAEGGLGTLFGVAKSTLSGDEFGQLSKYVPEMESLLKAAPEVSEGTKGVSSLLGEAGKYGDMLKSGTQAYSQFKSLGLDAGHHI